MARTFGLSATKAMDRTKISPVFLQWADCVYQLMRQNKNRFEFKTTMLVEIIDASINCKFGTFLLNEERTRVESKLHLRTESFWDYLLLKKEDYVNLHYQKTTKVLEINSDPRIIHVFKPFYFRNIRGYVSFYFQLKKELTLYSRQHKNRRMQVTLAYC